LRADSRQELEKTLGREYKDHILILRKFYLGDKLKFDPSGKLIGSAGTGPWTVASQLRVINLRVVNNSLELRGERIFLVSVPQNKFRSLFPVHAQWDGADAALFEDTNKKPKSKKLSQMRDVTISVLLGPEMMNANSAQSVLDEIFLRPYEKLATVVDLFWKGYLSRSDYSGGIPSNSAGGLLVKGQVSEPKPLKTPDPEYSEWAREAEYQGKLLLWMKIDHHGDPQDIRIIQPLGLGLDEQALAVVRSWKFQPALKGTQPVDVQINVAVSFALTRD
jgi:TonB family protein